MRSLPVIGVLVVSAAILLAACSTSGAAPTPGSSGEPSAGGSPATTDALSGRTFLSTGSEGVEIVEGSQVRLTFEDTRIGASAGCNQMSGEYEVVDGVLNVGAMAMTEMACDEPLMAQDTWLAEFLSGASASLQDTTLTLSKEGTTVTLEDETVANPDRPLEGTRWVVTGVIAGDAVSSVPAEPTASLQFDAGSVAVETGCNAGSGGYERGDGVLTFGPIATTLKMCEEDVAALEQAVTTVLQGEATYDIQADTLTLQNGVNGLVLTAEG